MSRILLVSKTLLGVGILSAIHRLSDHVVLAPQTIDPQEVALFIRNQEVDLSILDGTSLEGSEWLQHFEESQRTRLGPVIFIAPTYLKEEKFFTLFKWNCFACLQANTSLEALIATVQNVARGKCLLNSAILPPPVSPQPIKTPAPRDPTNPLSSREVEVLLQVAQGQRNRDIAQQLGLSNQTIKNHLTSILRKLHCHDRTSAVTTALRHQWIAIPGIACAEY